MKKKLCIVLACAGCLIVAIQAHAKQNTSNVRELQRVPIPISPSTIVHDAPAGTGVVVSDEPAGSGIVVSDQPAGSGSTVVSDEPTGSAICTHKTCEQLGKNCGDVNDTCGVTLHCGTCPAGQMCGGSGTANVCGAQPCEPTTCEKEGKDCGTISDGCSLQLDCGTCPEGQVCTDNVCIESADAGSIGAGPSGDEGTATFAESAAEGAWCTLLPQAAPNPGILLVFASLIPLLRRRMR